MIIKKIHVKNLFDNILNEKNTGSLFKLTKELLHWKTGNMPGQFLVEGQLISKPRDMANAQMDHYVNKLRRIKQSLNWTNTDPMKLIKTAFENWEKTPNIPTMKLREITEIETIEYIGQLGNSTSFGHDEIDSLSVKLATEVLHRQIRHLINTSIRNKTFTSRWKIAKIIPLLKSNELDKINPASFRPVSLLGAISKIAERTVQVQLLNHLENTRQIHNNQHAYRKMMSTTTALLQTTDILYKAVEVRKVAQTMVIDQSSAFDGVEHYILLQKLKYYNVGQETIKWIKSYLERRTHYVSIGKHNSRMESVQSGVPQGLVLGPLLFMIYTNEFPEVVRDEKCDDPSHKQKSELFGEDCEICGCLPIYADDAVYIVANKDRQKNQEMIEDRLEKIKDFLASNRLAIN